MSFFRLNFKAIILVFFACLSEVIFLPFSHLEHCEVNGIAYTLGDVIYSFTSQIGYLSFIPSLFLYSKEDRTDSKGILLGLINWNAIELAQEFNILFKLNIDFLNKSASYLSDAMQIVFIIFVVILSYFGYKKWFILSRFVLHTLHTFTRTDTTSLKCLKRLLKRKKR